MAVTTMTDNDGMGVSAVLPLRDHMLAAVRLADGRGLNVYVESATRSTGEPDRWLGATMYNVRTPDGQSLRLVSTTETVDAIRFDEVSREFAKMGHGHVLFVRPDGDGQRPQFPCVPIAYIITTAWALRDEDLPWAAYGFDPRSPLGWREVPPTLDAIRELLSEPHKYLAHVNNEPPEPLLGWRQDAGKPVQLLLQASIGQGNVRTVELRTTTRIVVRRDS